MISDEFDASLNAWFHVRLVVDDVCQVFINDDLYPAFIFANGFQSSKAAPLEIGLSASTCYVRNVKIFALENEKTAPVVAGHFGFQLDSSPPSVRKTP